MRELSLWRRITAPLHRAYAAALGYFWQPCPLCGAEFGGHEWRIPDRSGHEASIPDGDDQWGTAGRAICRWCSAEARGCEAWSRHRPWIVRFHDCPYAEGAVHSVICPGGEHCTCGARPRGPSR